MLLSVLVLSTLLISCATAFTWFVRTQARTISGERDAIAFRSMAQVLAEEVIKTLAILGEHVNYDSKATKIYQPFAIMPDENLGVWIVEVTPLDDKLPLRNLFLPDGNTLRREFDDVWQDMWEELEHRELEQKVLDFMDKNTRPRVGSIEQDWYINRPPYDMSELLMMSDDITPELLNELSTYCTIYSDGRINLNVAPLEVMKLLPGLDVGGLAEGIIRKRREEPLQDFNDIQNIPGAGPKTATQLTNIATFKSRYFELKIDSMTQSGEGGRTFRIIFDRTTRQIVRWEEQ